MTMITLEAASLQLIQDERQRGVAMTGRKRSQQSSDVALLGVGILREREAFGNQIAGDRNGTIIPLLELLWTILPVEMNAGDTPANPGQQADPCG